MSWRGSMASRLQGAVTWAFEFEDQPAFAALRALATDGIDKPVLNAFRLLMGKPARLDLRVLGNDGERRCVPLEQVVARQRDGSAGRECCGDAERERSGCAGLELSRRGC